MDLGSRVKPDTKPHSAGNPGAKTPKPESQKNPNMEKQRIGFGALGLTRV